MTRFWLLKDIPFSNDYENVVSFEDKDKQRSYFLNRQGKYESEAPNIRSVDSFIYINSTFEEALEYNYLVFENVDINGNAKTMFAFITDINYSDKNTTIVHYEIDVWQSYMFDYSIKNAFVKREHQDRFTKEGKPVFNLEGENIEIGTRYETIREYNLNEYDNLVTGNNVKVLWFTFICTDVLFDESFRPSNVNGLESGYYVYTLPIPTKNINATFFDNVFEVYLKGINTTRNILLVDTRQFSELLKNKKIVRAYVSIKPNFNDNYSVSVTEGTGGEITVNIYSDTLRHDINDGPKPLYIRDVISTQEFNVNVIKPTKNVDINKDINYIHEPKLYTKPFRIYSITNRSIEPLDVGLDELGEKVKYVQSFSFGYKSRLSVNGYNDSEFFNTIVNTKVDDYPLISEKLLDYLANSKASATTGVALSTVGAVGGFALASMGLGLASFIGLQQGMSGTQKVMNEIMKQNDLKSAPSSIKEIGNDFMFFTSYNDYRLKIYERTILDVFLRRAFNLFYQYGYTTNELKVPNLKSRYYFNYIMCTTIVLTGKINNNIKNKLSNIFIKGTTIWHYRNEDFEMYKYDKENVEMGLLSE